MSYMLRGIGNFSSSAAIAFDANSPDLNYLTGLPIKSDSNAFSLACFMNFTGEPGKWAGNYNLSGATPGSFTANGDVRAILPSSKFWPDVSLHNGGAIISRISDAFGEAIGTSDVGHGLFPTGFNHLADGSTVFPNGWADFLLSVQLTDVVDISDGFGTWIVFCQYIAYINETCVADGTSSLYYPIGIGQDIPEAIFGWSQGDIGIDLTGFQRSIGLSDFSSGGYGLFNFFMEYGEYRDWSDATIRAKFHQQSSGKFIPVDLGPDGSTPFGVPPSIFCTGGPTDFVTNRADGSHLTLTGNLVAAKGP